MRWNLRMVAAERGIWHASDLRRALSEAGLVISSGKMSNLWSGTPITVRLADLDVLCGVLGCTPSDLMLPEEPIAVVPEALPPSPAGTIRPSSVRRGRSTPPA
jgi:DNA-binding Xre family transcriptional regulator